MAEIGVLGAGTWGMALARMLANTGHEVTVWSALADEIDRLSGTLRHPNLPDMKIPESIIFTKEMEKVCRGKEILLLAVPSVFVRATAEKAALFIEKGQILVDVAKGLEPGSLFTMSEIIEDVLTEHGLENPVAALSGPTHAEEVAKDLPTTIVSACRDQAVSEYVQTIFNNQTMRVYTNPDVKGVEICGAAKNIIALAAGVSDGLGYGDNAKAALITRGMAEITRLGIAIGCDPHTFIGLAGIGDLIVTATSIHSRNHRCGELIGRGYEPKDAVKAVGMVVEGVNAIPGILEMADRYGVEMPICRAADDIVNQGKRPLYIVNELMGRRLKME